MHTQMALEWMASMYPNSSLDNSTGSITNSELKESFCCVPGSERIIVPLIFSIIVLFGCIGNALVIIVVIKNRDYHRNTTNLFILNLAIADMLFLVFCVPFHAVIYTTVNWPFGEFMCKSVHLVQYSSMVASVMTLVAMALDRYLAVGHPLLTKHLRTPKCAFFLSIIIWILSVGMAMPWPIFYTVREYTQYGPEPIAICADDWGSIHHHRSLYFLMLFILGYVIPLIAIFILSILMIKQLWSVGSDAHYRQGSVQAKRKVTRLVIVVVVVFALCWLPSHIIWIWTNYFPHTWKNTYGFYYMRIAAHILSYANSCMNPVIYAFLSTQFRKGFNRALHMKCSETRLQCTPQSTVRFHSKITMYQMPPNQLGRRLSVSLGDNLQVDI